MASDFEKPDKIHTLFPEEIPQKMWSLPVGELFMVGHSSVERLSQLGIRTIGDLAHTNPDFLQLHFKSHGKQMWEYANGIDTSVLDSGDHDLKGIGNSTTLATDVETAEDAKRILLALSDQVAFRLRKAHQIAQTVTVEIKYNTFRSCSRQTQLSTPDATSSVLYAYACRLFDELWNGAPIRLLGLRTSKLLPENTPIQLSLFDSGLLDIDSSAPKPMQSSAKSVTAQSDSRLTVSQADNTSTISYVNTEKQKRLERAMDQIRQKFGPDAVVRGTLMKKSSAPAAVSDEEQKSAKSDPDFDDLT